MLGGLFGSGGSGLGTNPSGQGSPDLAGLLGGLFGGADQGAAQAGGGGGLDAGSLFGAVLGGSGPAAGTQGSAGLAGLLASVLGGGLFGDSAHLGQTNLSPEILQAALPIVVGALMKGQVERNSEIDLGAGGNETMPGDLASRLHSGEPLDEE